jgi:malate dehydrogenase (oxaloacetate-decarboxylating)(NADP+)
MHALGLGEAEGIEIHNARISGANRRYADWLYGRLQRKGYLLRDVQRMVNQDRNVFGACMVAHAEADAMVSGLTRSLSVTLEGIQAVIDTEPGKVLFGLTPMMTSHGTVFVADTAIHERPDAETLAGIALASAAAARRLGHEPRVAFVSYSTFGDPRGTIPGSIRDAVKLLDQRSVDFEYDGEMGADVALDPALKAIYPFCRLTGPANVLVMPGLHAAHILTRALPRLSSTSTIGPYLIGLEKPVQIVPLEATVGQIVDMACLAAHQALPR